MKKPKKMNEGVVSNNKLNVTVGTLADAQKPEMRKGEKGPDGKGAQKDRYVYCDFAQIEEEEYDVDYEIDQEGLLQALDESTTMAAAQTFQHQSISYLQQPPPVLRASGWVRSQRFPTKLYALLSQPSLSGIITWMPHGRGWKVIKPRVFETSVLPVFFESDNYHSFNRVINAWSFRRKSTGPDRGSYFHELFLRGKPHLQKYMRRLPRTHKKLAMSKSEEPDFFELAKTSPLPTLEQARLNLESRKFMHLRHQLEKDAGGQGGQGNRSSHGNASHEKNALEQRGQNIQTKRQNLKNTEQWPEDQGNLNAAPPGSDQQAKYLINRGTTAHSGMKLPDTLFRIQQQQDDLNKDDMPDLSILRQPQHQQQQQQQVLAAQQQAEAAMMRQQQEQQLLARHRAQMMQQMEQEQYLRAQSMRQAELAHHQQQNQMNLLRQMDFFQNQQRSGF